MEFPKAFDTISILFFEVDVACTAFHQEHAMDADSDSEDDAPVQGVSPKEVTVFADSIRCTPR